MEATNELLLGKFEKGEDGQKQVDGTCTGGDWGAIFNIYVSSFSPCNSKIKNKFSSLKVMLFSQRRSYPVSLTTTENKLY